MSQAAEYVEDGLVEILSPCLNNLGYFCKLFLGDIFTSPWSTLHKQIFQAIDGDAQKLAIAAPRGIGKTSLASALVARSILFRERRFVVYISNSATLATMQTDNIKNNLLMNSYVRELFGSIATSYSEELGKEFSRLAWTAFDDTHVLPRGMGQQVRGLNWRSNRPDLIIIDDLEEKKELNNPNVRENIKNWFFSDVMKSIDRYSNNWRIIYIDTLKHEDSLLQLLLDSEDWIGLNLPLCTQDRKSLAPDYMSDEELEREYKIHKDKGLLDVFYMEYMNLPMAEEARRFKPEMFKNYQPEDVASLKSAESIVLCDPAKTVKTASADSAVIGVTIDVITPKILVRDIVHGKFYPDELYNEIFAMADRLGVRAIGVEVTSLNEFILQPLRNRMNQLGRFYEIIELKPRGGAAQIESKDSRIFSLLPYYRQGAIYHNESCCAALETQLLSMPKSKLKDVADVLSYIVPMLEMGGRYFSPGDISEASFESLMDTYDPPLRNWRRI